MRPKTIGTGGIECDNTCSSVLKTADFQGGPNYRDENNKETPNITRAGILRGDDWTFSFWGEVWLPYATKIYQRLNLTTIISEPVPRNLSITVDYCLDEPTDRVCYVGISNTLFLAVTICVLIKTVTAIIITTILGRRNQESLVTLGDAISSFIRHPDKTTLGMCTMGQLRMRRVIQISRDPFLMQGIEPIFAGPKRWEGVVHQRWGVVPTAVWVITYAFFAIGVLVAVAFSYMAYSSNSGL
jgi:hypothetical protein